MNVCFELKLAAQVLCRSAAAGWGAATLQQAPQPLQSTRWADEGERKGTVSCPHRERGGKHGKVHSAKRGREAEKNCKTYIQ